MAEYYLVKLARGAVWDHSRPRRYQAGWDEQAASMDALTEEGIVILGGPVGESDGEDVLLVVDVENEAAIRARPGSGDPYTPCDVWAVVLRARKPDLPLHGASARRYR